MTLLENVLEDNKKFFVQTCCGDEHYGQSCGCLPLAYVNCREGAKQVAQKIAEPFGLTVVDC